MCERIMNKYNVAVVGATGIVGETMLAILSERNFPLRKIYALASERSTGELIKFKDQFLEVENLANFDFSRVQIALFSAGTDVAAHYAPLAAAQGCIVIDNSSQFRYEATIPLVVPEVNPEAIAHYLNSHIIANPNCSTIQMVVALKPLYDAVGNERINVATYQSVSGTGKAAINELATQTTELINGRPIKSHIYPVQIAFNIIPQVDIFMENHYTREEMKMVWETQKILGDKNIRINATAVRVPVFFGHSEAIHIETRDKITTSEARKILQHAPGVVLLEEDHYPTPAKEGTSKDAVYVSRIREDISHPRGLDLWVVADNVRKGAALNAIQIAELLIKNYF